MLRFTRAAVTVLLMGFLSVHCAPESPEQNLMPEAKTQTSSAERSTPDSYGYADVNGIRIRPLAVVEDSRCPAQVQCVWAGRLVVRARMTGDGWTQIRDFELGVFQAVDRYRVTLITAEPPKTAPGEIDPRAYRFTFGAAGR